MSRPRNAVPSYRYHRRTGQAVVTLRSLDGRRRDVLLGPHGSEQSKTEYERILAELRATQGRSALSSVGLTVNELLAAYWTYAESYYVGPDRKPTGEQSDIRYALKPVKELYGHTGAAAFGPLALKAVRERMLDTGWNRGTINRAIGRVKRCFRWAVSEELVPAAVDHALQSVRGLGKGRSAAAEPGKVKPVPSGDVERTIPHLPPIVAAMVNVQLLTGMRPGELCRMRAADLDRSGDVWVYRPAKHKNAWRDCDRVVCIGPRAQKILAPFGEREPAAYLFDPRAGEASREAAKRGARKSKRWPSHQRRQERLKSKRGRRHICDHYNVTSYNRAIARACQAAGVTPWSANRLRHSCGTAVRHRYGLEASQVTLGHAHADVTQIYAEKNLDLARRVASEMG